LPNLLKVIVNGREHRIETGTAIELE